MRIAQVAPLSSCPSQLSGGTERMVSYLTEELVREGHEVSLFASGDSQTKAYVRNRFEERFSAARMAHDYLALYGAVLYRSTMSAATTREAANAA